MKILFNTIFTIFSLLFLGYVSLPTPHFPDAIPSNSLQSNERGDTEDFKNRRAYFTDHARDQVLAFHEDQLRKISWNGFTFSLPTYRLNYPPEDAMIYIKELTRSWYLEEIVHPFRESFFVNGFIPQVDKDAIIITGRQFAEKITVRYYKSNIFARVSLALFSVALFYILIFEWRRTLFTHND